MGDRTTCFLTLWGHASRKTMDDFYTLIHTTEYINPEDARQTLEENDEYLTFEEVNYGEMPSDIKTLLDTAGLNYAWSWHYGDNYAPGIFVKDGDKTWRYAMLDGEIMLSLNSAKDPEAMQKAQECQDAMDAGMRKGLLVADSAHELMELLKTAAA